MSMAKLIEIKAKPNSRLSKIEINGEGGLIAWTALWRCA